MTTAKNAVFSGPKLENCCLVCVCICVCVCCVCVYVCVWVCVEFLGGGIFLGGRGNKQIFGCLGASPHPPSRENPYKYLINILFRNKNYSKKFVVGCSRCSCQYIWCLGYCKASGSFQEQQNPHGFYWQGCENIWDWQFLRPRYD